MRGRRRIWCGGSCRGASAEGVALVSFHRMPSSSRASLLMVLLTLSFCSARTSAAQATLKVNGATAVLGVANFGVERASGARRSFQWDVTISGWRSVRGGPQQFIILVPEWRWYRRSTSEGPYVGLNTGVTAFRIQRWSYIGTEYYQEGAGVLFGGTIGYKRVLNRKWTMDLFVGGGTIQSKYKGYRLDTGERYDGERGWNESGEWLPYRGGVMFERRLP